MDINNELYDYATAMARVKLIRWHEMPEFSIYSDQLLQLVRDELSFMSFNGDVLVTKSMVNNYVKWGMMPKPIKKKYDKLQIVYVLVITLLKPILPIMKIKEGIQLQILIEGHENAYNSFCTVLEESLQEVFLPIIEQRQNYTFKERTLSADKLAISSITLALSSKLLTEKIIETKIIKLAKPTQSEGDSRDK
ncbi:DUF1836 domain-containing protein [Fusibacter bizertensis]